MLITLRYVPETRRSPRNTDIPGLLLVAAALISLTYGISVLQSGLDAEALVPIVAGVLAGVAFVWWELRCGAPALDLRIFRSPRFNAVVTAGAANNLVQGGSMIMVTFYLILIRGQSTWAFALLLIPATLLSALAALGAGRAAARWSNCTVVVAGLAVLVVSLLVRLSFDTDTPIMVVGAVIALTTIGGAIVQTPQATVMMSSAPANLGGVVSAVKASVGGTFYGLGSALFSMFGIILFLRDTEPKLAGSGISARQAGDILGTTGGAPGDTALDPERTAWVISEATASMLDAADALNLIMTVIPAAAIVVVLVLFRRERDVPAASARS